MKIFDEALSRRLIYIFEADDDKHRDLLKIGETTIKNLSPTEEDLKLAARKRIKEYAGTMGVKAEPSYVTLAVRDDGSNFRDTDVHRLLKKFKHKFKGSNAREWFKVTLQTSINAINAVKRRKKLSAADLDAAKIFFRPEQEEAIARTVKHFKKAKGKSADFLWNAKMRFGKTLCALEVARRMNFDKTIIITHRPVVDSGWEDDFKKIFRGTDYHYFGKDSDFDFGDAKKFICFFSIQDLRGSKIINDGKLPKNEKIFATDWDFVIVDEAHEGTTTELGDKVIKNILKPNSKLLELSGTPFNILDDFAPETVYTWDYLMEQRAKNSWHENHPDEPNPYADLPAMKIYTYDLGKLFNYFDADEKVFSFKEFFKTDGKNFVHAKDVRRFLDMLTRAENYPFSREDFRKNFRHSLWIIPGVKEGKALSKLLQRHKIFSAFEIVNVAGDGDSDGEPGDALEQVQNAIANHDYTITLSCGKLTAGVTVPKWTAVFMLAGSVNTSAANYLQTIFRVQSPCTRDGFVKENCFVFDFAPDRTLKVIAASAAVSARAGRTQDLDREHLDELLKFCPVISLDGSRMNYRADDLLQQLKSVYVERAVRNGFEDNCLYNDKLLNLSQDDLNKFDKLGKIVGSSTAQKKTDDIIVNDQGLDGTPRREKSKTTRTPEQQEYDRSRRQRLEAIKKMRAISVRLPLLIYGGDFIIDENFSLEVFKTIDDESWNEFMPAGITKDFFSDFIKFYDRDIFIAAAKKIRRLAQDADALPPTERVQKISELFATFRNPDKETVLTPWRVVRLHLDAAFDEKFFAPDKKILEINSKTGLYPLAVVEKIYRVRLGNDEKKSPRAALKRWDKTVAENIFVLCKTPMAVKITRRTLVGFRKAHVNARCFPDLIDTLKNDCARFLEQIVDKNFWSKGVGKMKFDAVVGNPPYQISTNSNYSPPVYHLFLKAAFKLADKVSLIHPARFLFRAGDTPKDFIEEYLNDEHIWVALYEPDSKKFFPTSDIKGGVAITLRDAKKIFEPLGTFIPFDELKSIHQKVVLDNENFRPLSEIIYSRAAYTLTEKFHADNPKAADKMSVGNLSPVFTNIFERFPEFFFDEKPSDGHEYIQMYGRFEGERVFRWARRDYISAHESLDKFKVFVPDANGSGAIGEVLSTPLVGSPLVGCTQTFITVGAFDTRAEAEACMAYIKSKFARAMLGILKVTQHNPPATWSKVPLENFGADSDIDWGGSVDAQLYDKYNLTAAEIKFIEEHVRQMP